MPAAYSLEPQAVSGDAPGGRDFCIFLGASVARCLRLGTAGGIRGRSGRPGLLYLPGGFGCPLLTAWNRGRYMGTLRAAGFFCISLGAHRAAVNTLSEIGKPG
ncbi:hypothetical protein, partial [Diplocloster agilis]|uniref:hypothetical protein n=1 Tax=Diplocloster agilis TaxID=2850323 RepID=UPI00130D59F2